MNVSVIIPVFKAEHFIRKAVESALYHHEVKEVILIEDGSPDNSLLVCNELAEDYDRVFLCQHPGGENKGAGASRNLGIMKASQEFICFLDADDYFTDHRFEKEKLIFAAHPDADGVYGATGVHYYDEIGASAWENLGFNESHLDTINKPVLSEHLFEFLISYRNPGAYSGDITILTLTLRRDKILEKKIFFDESLTLHQDTVFIWKCAYFLKLYSGDLERPLAVRGVHRNNRFIHHENLRESRMIFYKSLMRWAEEDNLKKDYLDVFTANYYRYKVTGVPVSEYLIRSAYYVFKSARYRKIILDTIYKRVVKGASNNQYIFMFILTMC